MIRMFFGEFLYMSDETQADNLRDANDIINNDEISEVETTDVDPKEALRETFSLSESEIKLCVRLFGLKVFLCLIEKRQLDSLNNVLKTYAAYATRELISTVGISMACVKDEVFFFSNEKAFVKGCELLNSKVAKLKDAKLTNIGVPPIMFLEMLVEVNPRLLHIDLGSDTEMRYGRQKILDFIRIGSFIRIAELADLYVVEDSKGFAVGMDLEGQEYALAFCEENDATEMLKSYKKGIQVAFNTTNNVLRGIMDSAFSGIILNPGTQSQAILTKQDVQIACDLIQLRKPPSLFSKEGLRSIFCLRQS